jgi:glycosyltransferase involved in cell wall biosynthesis
VSVPALCDSTSSLLNNVECRIIAIASSIADAGNTLTSEGSLVRKVIVQNARSVLESEIQCDASAVPLLHDHGQWIFINRLSSRIALERKIPRVVSPRGMLSPWSMAHKRFKKLLAWHLYAKRDLSQARVIHATSDLERIELRQLGVKQPIAVIPNGVTAIPTSFDIKDKPCRPYCLFMSRVHEKKGIVQLLEVWNALQLKDWDLIIAGPDEQGLMQNRELPLNTRFIGFISGRDKSLLLQNASLFVLPTHSENFGLVIAEALAAGVPVITTHGAPWQGLEERNCGWWIPPNSASLKDALISAVSLPEQTRKEMGAIGQKWVADEFSWSQVGQKMSAMYSWLMNRTSVRPSFVDIWSKESFRS